MGGGSSCGGAVDSNQLELATNLKGKDKSPPAEEEEEEQVPDPIHCQGTWSNVDHRGWTGDKCGKYDVDVFLKHDGTKCMVDRLCPDKPYVPPSTTYPSTCAAINVFGEAAGGYGLMAAYGDNHCTIKPGSITLRNPYGHVATLTDKVAELEHEGKKIEYYRNNNTTTDDYVCEVQTDLATGQVHQGLRCSSIRQFKAGRRDHLNPWNLDKNLDPSDPAERNPQSGRVYPTGAETI